MGAGRRTCGTGNSKSSGKRPREFADAKRPEIALRDVALWVLEGGLAVLE